MHIRKIKVRPPGISSPEMKWIKYREKTIEWQGLRL